MRYQKLFSISLFHSYFAGNRNTDQATPAIDQYLEIVPNPETKTHLQNFRLVLKRKPGTLHCLTPIKDDDTPLVNFAEQKFRFYLKIKDPQILQFSNFSSTSVQVSLGHVMEGVEFPLYTNENLASSIEEEFRKLELSKFEYIAKDRQPEREDVFTDPFYFFLKSNPIPGLSQSDFAIENLTDVTISGYEVGRKRLTLKGDGLAVSRTPFWVTYRAIPTWASETFGLIDLVLSANDRNLKYSLTIGTASSIWNYLFISAEQFPNTIEENGDSFTTSLVLLEEQDDQEPLLLSSTIQEANEDDFPIAKLLKNRYPNCNIYHIPTTEPIPLQQGIQKSIFLSKKKENNDQNKYETLISGLPNPTPDDQGIIIVTIPPPQT